MPSVTDILSLAVDLERNGRQFYLDAAARATDPVVESLLVSLAQDEEEHERVIVQFCRAIERNMDCDLPDIAPKKGQSARQRISEIIGHEVSHIDSDATMVGVYRTALEFELKARDYFRTRIRSVQDRKVARFLRYLATIEDIHVSMLRYLLKDMSQETDESAK